MSASGHSRYEGLRCPHCAGKLPGYVSRDAELARIRELTMVDTEVVRCQNQLAGATEACRQAAFLIGALGHGGEHEDCDPCEFVRTHHPAGGR